MRPADALDYLDACDAAELSAIEGFLRAWWERVLASFPSAVPVETVLCCIAHGDWLMEDLTRTTLEEAFFRWTDEPFASELSEAVKALSRRT